MYTIGQFSSKNKYLQAFIAFLFILFGGNNPLSAQTHKTENIVMVAMDGMRWQEIFGGVDSSLMNDELYTKEKGDMKKAFWDNDKSKEGKS